MARGKHTCKILKEIRRQIAQANDIEFATDECRYKGDCRGTCPKCEAEVRYLEKELRRRRLMGKAVMLAGISAGAIAMLTPAAAQSQTPDTYLDKEHSAAQAMAAATEGKDTLMIKGIVLGRLPMEGDAVLIDTLRGAVISNLRTGIQAISDIDGKFQIEACKGDTLDIACTLYESNRTMVVDSTPLEITLDVLIQIKGMVTPTPTGPETTLDLLIIDENKQPIPEDDVEIEQKYIDENGEEDYDEVYAHVLGESGVLRIYWGDLNGSHDNDGQPLKEATLRITVSGYDKPRTIKVKLPKRPARKAIRFKH